jgi:hypothetical protein
LHPAFRRGEVGGAIEIEKGSPEWTFFQPVPSSAPFASGVTMELGAFRCRFAPQVLDCLLSLSVFAFTEVVVADGSIPGSIG